MSGELARESLGSGEPCEPARLWTDFAPCVEIEDDGSDGRRRHALPCAGQKVYELFHAGVVTDEQHRARRLFDLADDFKQSVSVRLVDARIIARFAFELRGLMRERRRLPRALSRRTD